MILSLILSLFFIICLLIGFASYIFRKKNEFYFASKKMFRFFLKFLLFSFYLLFIFLFSIDLAIFRKIFLLLCLLSGFALPIQLVNPKRRFKFSLVLIVVVILLGKFLSYYFLILYFFFLMVWWTRLYKILILFANQYFHALRFKKLIFILIPSSFFTIFYFILKTTIPFEGHIYTKEIISKPVYGFSIENDTIYAVNKDSIYKINIKNKVLKRITVKNVKMERIKVQGNKVYVTSRFGPPFQSDLVVFKINPFRLIGVFDFKEINGSNAIEGNSKNEIYLTTEIKSKVLAIDGERLQVTRVINVPFPFKYDIRYFPPYEKVFISNWLMSPYIIEINLKDRKITKFFVGFSQTDIRIKDNLVFITLPLVGRVDIYTLPDFKKRKKIWLEEGIRALEVINNKFLVVGNFFNGKVYLVDWKNEKIVKVLYASPRIREIKYDEERSKLYVSSLRGLLEIDFFCFIKDCRG